MNKYPNYNPDIRDKFLNNFNDRGMLRWFGFYLSDHSAALKHQKNRIEEILSQKHHDQMEFLEIAEIIAKAIIHQKKVFIEINLVKIENDNLIDSEPIIGFIEGCTDIGLVICKQEIEYNDIHYIEVIENN